MCFMSYIRLKTFGDDTMFFKIEAPGWRTNLWALDDEVIRQLRQIAHPLLRLPP